MVALLEGVARQTGRTKSEVVRDALEMLRARGAKLETTRPAETMAGLIAAGTAAARGSPSAPASASRDCLHDRVDCYRELFAERRPHIVVPGPRLFRVRFRLRQPNDR